MPFAKRSVSPVDVSQHRLPPNVRQNELDCIANGTLANLIRQLSSLSRHAEDIFGELYREAVKVEHKTNTLFNRIDRLAVKVTQLDSKVEEVSLQDIHLRKPFKSSSVIDQQSLSRHTMPVAMAECYSRCDRPPDLDKLNHFRDDGKTGLKFYTDPDYFFSLWREEMLKDAENVKKVHKTKNSNEKRRKPRHSQENRQKYYDRSIPPPQPTEPAQTPLIYQTSHQHQLVQQGGHYMTNGRLQTQVQYFQNQQTAVMRPESLELQYGTSGYGSMESAASSQQHLRQQQQQRQSAVPLQEYAVISRKHQPGGPQFVGHNQQYQQRPNGSTGTTPSVRDFDQTSPKSMESSESGQSRYGQARPSQPPPAPPPPPPMNPTNARGGTQQMEDYNRSVPNGDLPNRFNELNLGQRMVPNSGDASPPPPPPPAFNIDGLDRSASPDLPPPPPPLVSSEQADSKRSPPPLTAPISSSASSAVTGNRMGNGPPPAPPPPPPPSVPAKITEQQPASTPAAGSAVKGESRTMDARSDLLKAIRQGIQLKKVDRQEEKERDDAAVEKGNDVAAILKRRMEDVMGRSESEDSASDFENDWDDD